MASKCDIQRSLRRRYGCNRRDGVWKKSLFPSYTTGKIWGNCSGHLADNSFDGRSGIPDLNSKVVEKGANE